MSKETALAKVSLFANLDPKYIKGIAQICTERTFNEGDVLMRQGDDGIGLYVILSGKVKVEKADQKGKQVETASNGPGDIMGEFSVLDGAKLTDRKSVV